MIKYKYLPFTHNKPRYQAVPNTNKKWQLKAQSQQQQSVGVEQHQQKEQQQQQQSSHGISSNSNSPAKSLTSKVVIIDTSAEDEEPLLLTPKLHKAIHNTGAATSTIVWETIKQWLAATAGRQHTTTTTTTNNQKPCKHFVHHSDGKNQTNPKPKQNGSNWSRSRKQTTKVRKKQRQGEKDRARDQKNPGTRHAWILHQPTEYYYIRFNNYVLFLAFCICTRKQSTAANGHGPEKCVFSSINNKDVCVRLCMLRVLLCWPGACIFCTGFWLFVQQVLTSMFFVLSLCVFTLWSEKVMEWPKKNEKKRRYQQPTNQPLTSPGKLNADGWWLRRRRAADEEQLRCAYIIIVPLSLMR